MFPSRKKKLTGFRRNMLWQAIVWKWIWSGCPSHLLLPPKLTESLERCHFFRHLFFRCNVGTSVIKHKYRSYLFWRTYTVCLLRYNALLLGANFLWSSSYSIPAVSVIEHVNVWYSAFVAGNTKRLLEMELNCFTFSSLSKVCMEHGVCSFNCSAQTHSPLTTG